MDVRAFLKDRLTFIRQLYALSTQPYLERKRKIEAEEEPFTVTYHNESGEPQFLEEWLEADESIQVIGRACISMLASTLHVYFRTWEQLLRVPADKSMFKEGWFKGYCAYMAQNSQVPFENCPINLDLLEELVLARNRVQHPESITTDATYYSSSDLRKLKHPFFVDADELQRVGALEDKDFDWFSAPAINITPDKLELAIVTVEAFSDWLETVEVPVDA